MRLSVVGILCAAFVTGCGWWAPAFQVQGQKQVAVEKLSFADQDITKVDARCIVAKGEKGKLTLQGNASDFPAKFEAGTFSIVGTFRGKEVTMQSGDYRVKRIGKKIEFESETTIPDKVFDGELRILHGMEVLLSRKVSIVEKK